MLKQISLAVMVCASMTLADGPGIIVSHRASADFALSADPDAAPWKGITGIFMDHGPKGDPVPGHRTEVRSRWTKDNVYFLYICPYQELHLHPNPKPDKRNQPALGLGRGGSFHRHEFPNIHRYKEFEMSPQGEWVDLDIDSTKMGNDNAWLWNSGFEVKARIDERRRSGTAKCAFPSRASTIVRRPRASRCASTSTVARARTPIASTSRGSPRTPRRFTCLRRSGACGWRTDGSPKRPGRCAFRRSDCAALWAPEA